MPPLPDVDAQSYNEYTADQFGQQTERRIGALGFQAATEARIASLNEQYAPSPQPEPAPEPSPTPTEPALPALSDSPETGQYSAPASLSAQPAAPILAAPASIGPSASSTPAPPSPPPAQAGGPDYVAAALNTADQHGLDPALFVSQIQQESGFNPNAKSPAGAQGIAQIVPQYHPGVDPSDPLASLDYAAGLMASHLKRFGGDVVKALAAYNAGPGAVEKFGGIPPYEETQRYVDSIMGRVANEASTNPAGGYAPGPTESLMRTGSDLVNQQGQGDISQFGDPQLTSDEAYAACGPAAAVRFAQRFGRNPTLREATDLASQVGWTSSQGMAGLSSEKALMDKLQVPTKLVNGAQWDVFAKEAQTGNPVTISTAGHYFTADGFNPDTGAFHVGKSGLDLKGGAEWMTPARMQALMGQVQGGLLADNPQVPAPSIADQDTNPLAWLGRQKDALGNAISGAASWLTNAGSEPGATGPLSQAAIDQSRQAFGSGYSSAQANTAERVPGFANDVVPDIYNPLVAGVGQAGKSLSQGDLSGAAGALAYGVAPASSLLEGPGASATREAVQPLVGPAAGRAVEAARPAVSEFVKSEEGALKFPGSGTPQPPAQPAYQSVMPSGTFEVPKPITTSTPPSQMLDNVSQWITQHFTDRDVSLSRVQQEYARSLGRPLNADEMAYELNRMASAPAAVVRVDEGLKPAIQAVGDDYQALRDYVTLRSNVQVADALGNDARMFSGGITKAESQKALTDLEAQLGSDRFKTVQDAADQVSLFSKDNRQRLVDSGVLTAQQAADLEARYPDWAKTRVLDYMKDPAGGQAAGSKIGLADRQLREYSLQGTEKAREDPLASTVAYTHQVERMAMKNDTFNAIRKLDTNSPVPLLRKVAQDYTPTKDQVTIIGFENGQKVKYVTDNKMLGEAINGTSILPVPEWTKAWGQIFRSLATSRNPLFLAGNAALDIPTYVIRESVRAGGPQHLPEILGELAKGYVDAFGGLLTNEFKGNTARLIKGGGGSGSYAVASEQQAGQMLADLQRRNVFQVNGKADVLRLAKDLATLQPVESLGQRIEYGPRTASFRLAEKRGANPVQAVINGRTVTVDFSQGGDVTKYINNFIPFFNVGFQGPAQAARAFHENPGAFAWTTGALLGAPAIAAEAWNRSDPQRAKDYADVPQYVKDQGVVVMLPGDVPIDAQGNRKPLYAVLKLREWAPFASLARDAASRVLGDDSKAWQEVAGSAARGFSPSQASSVGQLGTEALSGIPVLPAAAELQFNKDFFRNRDIVTNRADTNASAAAKALTPAIQAAVDKLGLNAEVRPSAVEFFIRNQGAGVGAAALGGSDLAAGTARRDTSPTSLPGVGGLVGRFVGNQTGQGMQTARDEGLTPSARQILRQNGITSTPGPASSSVNQIPLKLDEETRYQQLTNRYVDEAIHRVVQTPEWASMTQQGKDLVMQRTIGAARQRAGAETLSAIPEQERLRRLQTKSTAPSAPAVGAPTR